MRFNIVKRTAAYVGVGILGACITLLAVRARAAGIPDVDALTYTGYLENPDGTPLAGKHSLSVRLWTNETSKNPACSGELADAELAAGRFQVALPDLCRDIVKANPSVFVDVLIDGASLGRTKLGAVPYAVEAGHAMEASALEHGRSGFRASLTSNRSIAASTATKVIFDTEEFDLGKEYDPAKGEFTSSVDGFYFVQCALTFEEPTSNTVAYYRASIYIDGVAASEFGFRGDGQTVGRTAAGVHQLKAGSVVTCVATHEGTAAQSVRKEPRLTHFEASRLSIAQ